MRYVRNYFRLATPLLSSPASGYGYNGDPDFVDHFCILDGGLDHFRRENTGCYRIHCAEVRLLPRLIQRLLTSDGDIFECELRRHHPSQVCRRRFAAIVRELRDWLLSTPPIKSSTLGTHVSLGEFGDATDTGDVYDNGTVVSTSLGEQTEEGGSDKKDGKRVDLIQLCPLLGSLVLEQGHPESLWVCVLWGAFMPQEFRFWSDLSSTEGTVSVESQGRERVYLLTRMWSTPSASSMTPFASMILSRSVTSTT